MGQIGVWQIVIVAVVVVLLFGRGKISAVMGDVAKGINSFKKGLNDTEEDVAKSVENGSEKVVDATVVEKSKTT
ncbi:MAG: twin-arginine translocase TatA/TatE family subunit [Pseudomonadota bacterium]